MGKFPYLVWLLVTLIALCGVLIVSNHGSAESNAEPTQQQFDGGAQGPKDAQGAGYYCISAGFCFCHNQTECKAMISSGECVPDTVRYHKKGVQGEASCQWNQKD